MNIRKSAKTVDEAVQLALNELNCGIDDVEISIIEEPKSGFFGFGSREALVEVALREVSASSDVKKEVVLDKKEVLNIENDVLENSDDSALKIKAYLEGLIKKMGSFGEVTFKEDEEAISFEIEKSDDFKMFIGKSGETLDSIQYILNIFARRNCNLNKRVYLDVNGYKVKKEDNIREMAMTFAKKAIKYRKVMRLKPMNAYERRIVHSTLHNVSGVFTVSEGEEPYRKVVIKPKF